MKGFREVKRHLDKPDEVFACRLVDRGRDWVVLTYVAPKAWTVSGSFLPAGSTTLAFYQSGADYVMWRMAGPDGRLVGYLFHVCSHLDIREGEVTYRDLLLDVWVDASGKVAILDGDELALCVRAGSLTPSEASDIARTGISLSRNWEHLITALKGYHVGSGEPRQATMD